MKDISVERLPGWYGRFRKLKLLVDGEVVGTLANMGATVLRIDPSAERLWGQMDWGVTDEIALVDLPSGATIRLRGRFTWNLRQGLGLSRLPFEIEVALPRE